MSEQLTPQETQLTPEQILQAGSEFLQHFGVEVSPKEQPEEFLEAMKQLDPRYEQGRELVRWELASDQREWPEETKDIIMRTAESMRMLEPETPLVGDFDVVIALGGANQQNHERPRYALEALKGGAADFKQLVIAGSSRVLKEAEIKNTENYAPGAQTEFDLCVAGAGVVAKENPEVPVSVLFVDNEKAGTPDVIKSVLDAMKANGSLKDGARIAAVTTQIYQASTELDLNRVATQFGVSETMTAGIPSPVKTIEGRTPATYLSEILRTLKAATHATEFNKELAEWNDAVKAERDATMKEEGWQIYEGEEATEQFWPGAARIELNPNGDAFVYDRGGELTHTITRGGQVYNERTWAGRNGIPEPIE